MRAHQQRQTAAGFSLPELLIAMGITLMIMVITSTLLAKALGMRSREQTRSEAIADVQRALNIMSREIANSGYSLPSNLTYSPAGTPVKVPANGLLPAYSNGTAIAFVSNLTLDANGVPNNHTFERDETILFQLFNDPVLGHSFLIRKDLFTGNVMVLANRIDGMAITYYDVDPATGVVTARAANSAPTANTVKMHIRVTVTLPAVGQPRSPGYQPPWQTQLETQVALRNAILIQY